MYDSELQYKCTMSRFIRPLSTPFQLLNQLCPGIRTSAMLSILGKRERHWWLWPMSHMPCIQSCVSWQWTITEGQHGMLYVRFAYDSTDSLYKMHSVIVVPHEDVVAIDTVHAQRQLVMEWEHTLVSITSDFIFAENVRSLILQWGDFTFAFSTCMCIVESWLNDTYT